MFSQMLVICTLNRRSRSGRRPSSRPTLHRATERVRPCLVRRAGQGLQLVGGSRGEAQSQALAAATTVRMTVPYRCRWSDVVATRLKGSGWKDVDVALQVGRIRIVDPGLLGSWDGLFWDSPPPAVLELKNLPCPVSYFKAQSSCPLNRKRIH